MKPDPSPSRRTFLHTAAGLTVASTTHVSLGATPGKAPVDGVIHNEIDVLVVGGGTAGFAVAHRLGQKCPVHRLLVALRAAL